MYDEQTNERHKGDVKDELLDCSNAGVQCDKTKTGYILS